jgi:hypothetical protein
MSVFMHAVVLTYGEGVLLEMLFASACAIFLYAALDFHVDEFYAHLPAATTISCVYCVQAYEFQVTKDDVLVLGSDGIFDNLFEGQIVAVIIAVQKARGGPEVIARELVKLAQKVGHMKQGVSPFAVAAHGAGYTSYVGGKLDDTTAVVAVMI